MRIFLIGMPFSGKSTTGKLLATQLGLKFFDLDIIITEESKISITEIFQLKGESHFRLLEQQALNNLIKTETNFVLACGGGTPCYFDNLQNMNANGHTVFLDVPVAQLVERAIKNDYADRPLLKEESAGDLIAKFSELLVSRSSFYRQAQHHYNTGTGTIDELISLFKPKKI